MAKYDYVIFDFDGTVVDTGEGILKSLQYAFEKMGDPVPTIDELKKFIGPPIHYSFVTYYSVSEEDVGKYIEKYRERYRTIGIKECSVFEGMGELLQTLSDKGIKLGIASSKPQDLIYSVADYKNLTHFFSAISGTAFDDSNHASKTDLVQKSMDILGAKDKSKVLMVGDRCYDIDGGAGAGVDTCGVTFGYGSRQEFLEHHATYIVDKAEEIEKIVFGE